MKGIKRRRKRVFKWLCLPVLMGLLVWVDVSKAEFEMGNKYDQTNYQQIQGMLIPSLLSWVKKGEFILQTGRIEFEWKKDSGFMEASRQNEGKYAIKHLGTLVDRVTGKPPKEIFGFPFPKIDPKDSKAAEKIMENNFFVGGRWGSVSGPKKITWIGRSGMERTATVTTDQLYYLSPERGGLQNPNNFSMQMMTYFIEPMQMKKSAQMFWTYNDIREDSAWAYDPSVHGVRRVSASSKSDPQGGSDFCADDTNVWSGKNSTMKWRLTGQKTILVPFASAKKYVVPENPDRSIPRQYIYIRKGFEVPGWKGAPWCPVDVIWHPRPVWILEATPMGPLYNYGKQVLYVDQDTFTAYFKEIYDKTGEYWKTVFVAWAYQVTPKGMDLIGSDGIFSEAIDDKARHVTSANEERSAFVRLPLSRVGPDTFTETTMLQRLK